MKEYTITRCCGTPDWDTVPTLAIDTLLWTSTTDIQAYAQICYDEDALHVCLRARENHIRAEETGPLGAPYEDSCLEFFFCPMPGDSRYFNIECNPTGCLYLGFGNEPNDLVRLLPECAPIQPQTQRTDDGWMVTYCVPYRFIRHFFPDFQPVSGSCIRANCYKCGDLTPNPHFLAWNPIQNETPAFHRPLQFGLMRFA